jgi:hypothetical protein
MERWQAQILSMTAAQCAQDLTREAQPLCVEPIVYFDQVKSAWTWLGRAPQHNPFGLQEKVAAIALIGHK